MSKFVYDFAEGSKDLKDLLGGKGANLAEMTNLGLPVPPGFTISTEACRAYLSDGQASPTASPGDRRAPATLEQAMGRRLGDADDPLLVSVRSGAKFSMPGMMETVLNVGLNDESVARARREAGGDERFALGLLPPAAADVRQHRAAASTASASRTPSTRLKDDRGAKDDLDLTPTTCASWSATYKESSREHTGRAFPQDPREQLDLAVRAVFDSWNTDARCSTAARSASPADLGTAVNVCSMVFGNLGMDSGTGVAFTRDPATGAQGVYGDYLQNAQGEDVVAGIRNTVPLADLEQHRQAVVRRADGHHGDARAALPGPVRHRVHRRARQAVDAADPGRQAHRGGRLPHRRAAGRRGPHRPRRGAEPGHRRASSRS